MTAIRFSHPSPLKHKTHGEQRLCAPRCLFCFVLFGFGLVWVWFGLVCVCVCLTTKAHGQQMDSSQPGRRAAPAAPGGSPALPGGKVSRKHGGGVVLIFAFKCKPLEKART